MSENPPARMFLLSRSLWAVSIIFLVSRMIMLYAFPQWAWPSFDPSHPAPADGVAKYHMGWLIPWCANHGYFFYFFVFGAFVFMLYVDRKYAGEAQPVSSDIS